MEGSRSEDSLVTIPRTDDEMVEYPIAMTILSGHINDGPIDVMLEPTEHSSDEDEEPVASCHGYDIPLAKYSGIPISQRCFDFPGLSENEGDVSIRIDQEMEPSDVSPRVSIKFSPSSRRPLFYKSNFHYDDLVTPCSVCYETRGIFLLKCCHAICSGCYRRMCDMTKALRCPVCRAVYPISDAALMYLDFAEEYIVLGGIKSGDYLYIEKDTLEVVRTHFKCINNPMGYLEVKFISELVEGRGVCAKVFREKGFMDAETSGYLLASKVRSPYTDYEFSRCRKHRVIYGGDIFHECSFSGPDHVTFNCDHCKPLHRTRKFFFSSGFVAFLHYCFEHPLCKDYILRQFYNRLELYTGLMPKP